SRLDTMGPGCRCTAMSGATGPERQLILRQARPSIRIRSWKDGRGHLPMLLHFQKWWKFFI
ncbi:MAG: hypothetical protein OXD01_03635, partial [Gammaproteobacteria bacterium]|nr:hypothetical protein [Gammaproteobacteria bacterium]